MRQINEPNSAKRHSKLGIASTIIGVGMPLLITFLLIVLIVMGVVDGKTRSGFAKDLGAIIFLVALVVCLLAPLLHLTGLILGIIGAFLKETKKSFAVAGIILNLVLGVIGAGLLFYILPKLLYAMSAFH